MKNLKQNIWLAIIFVAFICFVFWPNRPIKYEIKNVVLNNQFFKAEVANTDYLRARGFSFRESIDEKEAMLFIFNKPAQYQFWMKDMNFSIDIIWFDSQKKVISFEENISPSSYPKSFYPQSLAKYVLEVKAGTIEKINLSIGDKASF